MPEGERAHKAVHSKNPHRQPGAHYLTRAHVLFYLALVGVLALTILTIYYNVNRTAAEPFSDLTDLMKKPLANVNFP